MPKRGCDFEKWFQNETAFQHARMRYSEPRGLDNRFTVEQNVHIDCARALGTAAASTASCAFDPFDDGQKLQREIMRFAPGDEIQEPRLIEHILRLGFVEGRAPEHANPFGLEAIQSFFDILPTVPEIRSEREVNGL